MARAANSSARPAPRLTASSSSTVAMPAARRAANEVPGRLRVESSATIIAPIHDTGWPIARNSDGGIGQHGFDAAGDDQDQEPGGRVGHGLQHALAG